VIVGGMRGVDDCKIIIGRNFGLVNCPIGLVQGNGAVCRHFDSLPPCTFTVNRHHRDNRLVCRIVKNRRQIATHFLQHGHSRIGAAFSETPTSQTIRNGWQEIVDATDQIDCPFVLTGMMPYDTHGVSEIADTIVSSEVTAILVHSDYLAIAISQALEQRGKHVPEDISIISIDGFATPSSRPLTVLRSSAKDLAEICVRTLINRIQNPDQPTQHIFVDPILVDRGSVVDCK